MMRTMYVVQYRQFQSTRTRFFTFLPGRTELCCTERQSHLRLSPRPKKKKTYCSSGRAPWRVCAVSTRVAQRAKSTVQCHWQARDTRLAALLVAPFRASTSPLFHQTGYSCRAFRGRLSWAINQLRKQASRPPARFFDLGRPKSPTESAARAEQKIKKIRSLVSPPSVIGQIYVPAWTALHQALRRCIPFHPFHSTARMPLGHRRIEARISFAALCARSSRATL